MENLHHQVSQFNAISCYNFFIFLKYQLRINKRELISAPKASRELNNKDREDVPLGGVYVRVFICMPGESYRRYLSYLFLYSCDVFRALMNSIVC